MCNSYSNNLAVVYIITSLKTYYEGITMVETTVSIKDLNFSYKSTMIYLIGTGISLSILPGIVFSNILKTPWRMKYEFFSENCCSN